MGEYFHSNTCSYPASPSSSLDQDPLRVQVCAHFLAECISQTLQLLQSTVLLLPYLAQPNWDLISVHQSQKGGGDMFSGRQAFSCRAPASFETTCGLPRRGPLFVNKKWVTSAGPVGSEESNSSRFSTAFTHIPQPKSKGPTPYLIGL